MPSASSRVRPRGTGGMSGTTACAARDRSHAQRSEHGEDPPVVAISPAVQDASEHERARRHRRGGHSPFSFSHLPSPPFLTDPFDQLCPSSPRCKRLVGAPCVRLQFRRRAVRMSGSPEAHCLCWRDRSESRSTWPRDAPRRAEMASLKIGDPCRGGRRCDRRGMSICPEHVLHANFRDAKASI